MTFHATDHAIRRYMERIEPCRHEDAEERVLHAASIAKPLSPAWARAVVGRCMRRGAYPLWCEVESLVLICLNENPDVAWVLTVFRRKVLA